eukprot:8905535-Lingulodinium_polyedra.AAC.1
MRDFYHREWNDVLGAVQQAWLRWVVLVSSVAFNLLYGPWEGSTWFQHKQEVVADLLAHTPASEPLSEAFY